MTTNKKLSILYIFGVLLPVALMFFNGYLADKSKLSWNYINEDFVFQTTLAISIILCGFVVIINHKQQKISFWYTLSITTAIALGFLLYIGTSLSNFGF